MKSAITDQARIAALQKRVNEWFAGLAAGASDIAKDIGIAQVVECSEARIGYSAEMETRALIPLLMPDRGDVKAVATLAPFDREKFDIWAVRGETINELINYRHTIAVPESLRAKPCHACGGTGAINCPACAGQKAIYCPDCRGSGKETCPTCRGSKNVPCEECGMSGQVFDSLTGTRGTCPRCQGKKESPCPSCGGKGGQPCPKCNGRQRIPCVACNSLGTEPCKVCATVGKLITGVEIESTCKPVTETLTLKSNDVPQSVAGALGASVAWQRETITDALMAQLPKEIADAASRLHEKITLPPHTRIIFDQRYIEKRVFYQVAITVAGSRQTIWIAGDALTVFSEVNPVLAVYADMLKDIRRNIESNDLGQASQLLAKLEGVPSLADEVKKLRGMIRLKVLLSGVLGGLAGSALVSAGGVPLLMHALSRSLNAHAVAVQAAVANFVIGALMGLVMVAAAGKPGRGLTKRMLVSAGGTVVALCLMYGVAVLAKVNPARGMDERQMKAEYAAYFPFGLRTLATAQDIAFIQKLIGKYEPAGVDLAQQRQDLQWLKEKIARDNATLIATEKTRQNIENIDSGKKNMKQSARPAAWKKKKSRIQIR